MEEAKITFYTLRQCGYYKRGFARAPVFGDIADIFGHLANWSGGRPLVQTKTHNPHPNAHALPAYLKDVSKLGSAWLLTLWNEAANTDGTVASINGAVPSSRAKVSEMTAGAGHIPGHATYFWVLPAENLIATVQFQHSVTGVYALNKYMQGFLQRWTPYVVHTAPNATGGVDIAGYRQLPSDPVANLRPAFQADIFKKRGEIDWLAARAGDIRKMKKQAVLKMQLPDNRALWQRLLADAHLTSQPLTTQEVEVQYEFPISGMTEQEFRVIVAEWEAENGDDDYGFVLSGEAGKVRWLGRAYARDTLSLNVDRENIEIVNPESLLRELQRHKRPLVALTN